jgi:hypothetical protein
MSNQVSASPLEYDSQEEESIIKKSESFLKKNEGINILIGNGEIGRLLQS